MLIRLLEYVAIGPRFSNLISQTLLLLLKRTPPKVSICPCPLCFWSTYVIHLKQSWKNKFGMNGFNFQLALKSDLVVGNLSFMFVEEEARLVRVKWRSTAIWSYYFIPVDLSKYISLFPNFQVTILIIMFFYLYVM